MGERDDNTVNTRRARSSENALMQQKEFYRKPIQHCAIPVRFIQHLVARCSVGRARSKERKKEKERDGERERERELFFFILFDFPTRIMNRVPKGGGIETFRNSHGRPLVSHATHQLNVNVCLCVRREPLTFIDVHALNSRHRCAPVTHR